MKPLTRWCDMETPTWPITACAELSFQQFISSYILQQHTFFYPIFWLWFYIQHCGTTATRIICEIPWSRVSLEGDYNASRTSNSFNSSYTLFSASEFFLRACLKAVKVERINRVAELRDNCNLYKSPETSAPSDEQACLWLIKLPSPILMPSAW